MNQRIFPITMPKWGIEMQQGTITEWHATPGSQVQKGAELLAVETDKIVNSVEAPVSGVLRLIIADVGATENVGALIAVFAEPSVSDAEIQAFVRDFKAADARFESEDLVSTDNAASSPPPPAPGVEPVEGEARISPIARRVAERLGIDPTQVKGTGRNGRVSKEDVEAFAAARGSTAAAPPAATQNAAATAAPRRTKLTSMRSAIAKRLLESKQSIPHYRVAVDVDCAALASQRAELAAEGSEVSINDLMVKAAAIALIRHPIVNSHLIGDEILTFDFADICIAVATDSGLITPVVRGAEAKSPAHIGAECRELARRARAGTLTRDEISGGTFTISNLGMFGVDRFDAIINPPQVAILAIGAATDRVVAKTGVAAIAKMATLTLSADHRVVDGAIAAQFLATLKSLLEKPLREFP